MTRVDPQTLAENPLLFEEFFEIDKYSRPYLPLPRGYMTRKYGNGGGTTNLSTLEGEGSTHRYFHLIHGARSLNRNHTGNRLTVEGDRLNSLLNMLWVFHRDLVCGTPPLPGHRKPCPIFGDTWVNN